MSCFVEIVDEQMSIEDYDRIVNVQFEFVNWYKNTFTYTGKSGDEVLTLCFDPEYRDSLEPIEDFASLKFIEPSNLHLFSKDKTYLNY